MRRSGAIGYSSGEDNHKWDVRKHKPLAHGIPAPQEALQKTLGLLPHLGISEQDLEHNADGSLRWTSDTEGTTYTDREDGKRKRYIRQVNVRLWQKIPGSGSILSVGGGGALKTGFISEGKLAELELLFRKLKPLCWAKPRAKNEIVEMLRNGEGRTYLESVPNSITVTNCIVVYPQGNMMCKAEYLWPFYGVSGFAAGQGRTNAVNVYVSLAWP